MIASYKHNFIFIKTRKTAGTSMEVALSTHVGENDIVTPISVADELVRKEVDGATLPQNYRASKETEAGYRAAIMSGEKQAIAEFRKTNIKGKRLFKNHMSAATAKDQLDPAFWNGAFKFTIERHPYEKAVSHAFFQMRGNPNRDFAKVLERQLEIGRFRNYDLYTIDGALAVDYVVRYERLQDDIRVLEERLNGLSIWDRLPHTKHGFRADRRPAAEILSDAQKAKIRERCREEFEMFGYAA
jgi:hypothetical protein